MNTETFGVSSVRGYGYRGYRRGRGRGGRGRGGYYRGRGGRYGSTVFHVLIIASHMTFYVVLIGTIMVEEEGVEHTTKRGVVEVDEVGVVTIKIAPPPNNSIGEPKISDCEI